jgi:hypothetical protein
LSGWTTGELTIALDWAARCLRRLDIHAVVPDSAAGAAARPGVTVSTYPSRGGILARHGLRRALERVRPEIVVVADILLLRCAPYEFGVAFDDVVEDAARTARVLALDLYDWDALLEQPRSPWAPLSVPVPRSVGRLLPSPYLPPAPSSPGRGRYAMMETPGPASRATRAATRLELGLPATSLAMVTTSTWQHQAAGVPAMAACAEAFPDLMLRLLDLAAQRTGQLTLLHVGPRPLPLPPGVRTLAYRHATHLAPDTFGRLLGSVDLFVTPNTLATTAVRAATMAVPVAALRVGRDVDHAPLSPPTTPAQAALATFLARVCPTPAVLQWPFPGPGVVGHLLANNPFTPTQTHLDVLEPDAAVDALHALLAHEATRDGARHLQAGYFDLVGRTVGTPEDALEAALRAGSPA